MMKTVAIIGAGAAGLCCARHFSRYPNLFQIRVFEKGSEIGGTWVYENSRSHCIESLRDVRDTTKSLDDGGSSVHSSMYKNLRTNFPKEIMCFPDFPFDVELPSFPRHSDVLSYLHQYADRYNLHRFIQFNHSVESVAPVHCCSCLEDHPNNENGYALLHCGPHGDILEERACNELSEGVVKWTVDVVNLKTGERTSEVFDFVLLCSGHFFNPFIPDISGLSAFPGKIIHSHTYRKPEVFKEMSVLVVGNGYSGRDIMIDLADHTKAVYFCNRGELLACPLPPNIEQLPALHELTPKGTAYFINGEERHVDAIILATGYKYSFPFLGNDCGIVIDGGKRIRPLYKHTFNIVHPSMAIIGMNTGVVPFLYFDLQMQWVMSVWKGEKLLPTKEEMIRSDEETYQQRLQEGLPPHLAGHFLGDTQWDFYRELADLGGSELVSPESKIIYGEWEKLRTRDVMNYKHTNIFFDGNKYSFLRICCGKSR